MQKIRYYFIDALSFFHGSRSCFIFFIQFLLSYWPGNFPPRSLLFHILFYFIPVHYFHSVHYLHNPVSSFQSCSLLSLFILLYFHSCSLLSLFILLYFHSVHYFYSFSLLSFLFITVPSFSFCSFISFLFHPFHHIHSFHSCFIFSILFIALIPVYYFYSCFI